MAKAHSHVVDDLDTGPAQGAVSTQFKMTLLGGLLLICSFLAGWLFGPGVEPGEANFYAKLLGLAAALLLGTPLIIVAIRDLREGHMHMNELVALAVVAAIAIGSYQEAAAIAFFMIISVLIENRTAQGAQASIESLVRITPTRAHVLGEDGTETEGDARDLKTSQIVRVRPGDNIPADGRVLRGASTVNQASITGESLPADKNDGDEVFGGTINLTGVMDIEVTKAGQDTTLGRVKDLILQAESTRIPIMRMIDQYAKWYTPTILMLVFIVWFFAIQSGTDDAMSRVIAMLVIACPCALILATPTAVVAGLSAAARLGVLVKKVEDLEAARNLTAMIFDKTGTLTTGELEVTRLSPVEGVEAADLLQAAAAAEQNSRHPVARAVVNVARRAKLHLPETHDFEEVSGRGVRAVVDGHTVLVGRATWLADGATAQLDADTVVAINEAQSAPDAEGLSVLSVVRDGKFLGWIGLADNARAGAAASIDKLRDLGLKRLIIVTGDRESVAKRVAGQLHAEYKAEVLPHEKLEMVDALKAKGHRVAVIGDGVNDAPALAAGDISIAMGAAGSDVAIHSAKIALMNNNLNRIPFLIDLSRKTSRVIYQNLLIGFVFIVVFFTLSAMGEIRPITAAVLHVVGGLVVVFNSARLVRSGEDIEQAEAKVLAETGGKPTSSAAATPQPA